MLGNTTLVHYGIQNDQSDYHIHVGFKRKDATQYKAVYVFKTSDGVLALSSPYATPFSASQKGVQIITGKGVKVPWLAINGCYEIEIPGDILIGAKYIHEESTFYKGRCAIYVVTKMMARGLICLPTIVQEVEERDMQMKGKDMIVVCKTAIQVKCDAWATDYGISLQTAECNPFGLH